MQQEEEEEEERLVARSLWSRSSVRLLLLHPPTHPLATPTSSTANPKRFMLETAKFDKIQCCDENWDKN